MTRIVIGAVVAAVAVSTVACSGGSASVSPASPSTTGVSAQRLATTTPVSAAQSDRANRQDDAEHGSDDKSELEGRISSADPTTHLIVVRGTTVHVLADTVIRHGQTALTFNDLKTGTQVHVRGVRNGTVVDARLVIVQDGNDNDEDENGAQAEGAIAGLTSTNTCPAITFKVGAALIVTDAATVFRGRACTQLANGTIVEVHGTPQANGSILASTVKVPDDDEHDND